MFSVEGFGFRDALLLRMWPWSRPEDAEGLKGESWTCWDEKHSVNPKKPTFLKVLMVSLPIYMAQKTYPFISSLFSMVSLWSSLQSKVFRAAGKPCKP